MGPTHLLCARKNEAVSVHSFVKEKRKTGVDEESRLQSVT